MRFRPAHQSVINRRHDGRASCLAGTAQNKRLKESYEFTRLLLGKADMRADRTPRGIDVDQITPVSVQAWRIALWRQRVGWEGTSID